MSDTTRIDSPLETLQRLSDTLDGQAKQLSDLQSYTYNQSIHADLLLTALQAMVVASSYEFADERYQRGVQALTVFREGLLLQ